MSNSLDLPFETTLLVRDTCLCLHVQRAARALARRFDEALRPAGLTNGQFSLMMSLNRPAPPPMKPVAELLAMDQTTLTAALKPLQRQGWIEIVVNPNDRRERLLQLTQEGKAALAAAVPIWKATHADIEKQLISGNGDEIRHNLLVLSSA
ncbi:MarR family transcriptional regulator [Brucella oryzae]|uniref:MarR family winged helix-turn-helix transcriptional regulator n=1 Tax=Brucella oryzae TaxID=335286 RepID=UPI001B83C709|nr:MarR family transcriptional regulator [Brucella oryzae]MBR7654195.1 MarR family transcriptional regulator [Brucella oryzae]